MTISSLVMLPALVKLPLLGTARVAWVSDGKHGPLVCGTAPVPLLPLHAARAIVAAAIRSARALRAPRNRG